MTAHVAIQTAVIAVIAVTGSDGGSLGDSCPLYAREQGAMVRTEPRQSKPAGVVTPGEAGEPPERHF